MLEDASKPELKREVSMKAIALRKGASNVELIKVPRTEPQPGEVLIQALETGICGTDREMIERKALDTPPGSDYLILGHEGLGRVVETSTEPNRLKAGDLVVPIVRRGCGQCNACNSHQPDYCYTGKYTERGIHWQHGFFSEYYADRPEYLVTVDPSLLDIAVLAEPMSVSMKAHLIATQFLDRVRFNNYYSQAGATERVLVAGHGPIGMLGVLLFLSKGWEVAVLGRRPSGDAQRTMIESLGATYLASAEEANEYSAGRGFLIIFEATGLSEVTFSLPQYLGRNGVLVLTGVPRGPKQIQIDGNTLMAQLVRTNQTMVGSVNACADCFGLALAQLAVFRKKYPTVTHKLITSRIAIDNYQEAFTGKGRDEIKVVITFPNGVKT